MIASTYGDFNNPKLVLINPLMTYEKTSLKVIKKLSKKYYLVILTPSGYYPNSTFSSCLKEELEMSIYFKSHNLNKIDIMIGLSIGGNIAYDFYCKNTDIIDRLILDSAPIYKSSFIKKQILYFKCNKVITSIIKDKEHIEDILHKYYGNIIDYQKDIIPMITSKTIKNIINSCFSIKIQNLSKKNQSKITLVYGSKDKARYCKYRFRKYKNINYVPVNNADHCQFFMQKTDSYIKKIINQDSL